MGLASVAITWAPASRKSRAAAIPLRARPTTGHPASGERGQVDRPARGHVDTLHRRHSTWGAEAGPPKPPCDRRTPANTGRSSSPKGGAERAPPSPPRSSRPGEPGALLDIPMGPYVRSPQLERGEGEQGQGERHDPEAHDDLRLRPPLELEVMVQRGPCGRRACP